jgi:hypothetical protein
MAASLSSRNERIYDLVDHRIPQKAAEILPKELAVAGSARLGSDHPERAVFDSP